MGHVLNYTLGDVVSHVRRRHGFAVLRPMGYDAFGLPAENAAIREGGHPREVTDRNIAAIRAQIKRMGWSIDWSREVSTHEPEYYRWTQWLFLQLYEQGARLPEGGARQVVPVRPDRARERAGDRRPLRALRQRGRVAEPRAVDVQDHRLRRPAARRHGAARLARPRADDAAQLDRPLGGRRGDLPGRGARRGRARSSRRGPTRSSARRSSCSRPSIRSSSSSPSARPTARCCASTRSTLPRRRARSARPARTRPASSPASTPSTRSTTERIPIWVADYVLMDYGTGAIMAVPAHDERDFAFAEKFGLPIVQVVAPASGEVEEGSGLRLAFRRRGARQLRPSSRASRSPEAKTGDRRLARVARPRPRRGELPPPRLAALAPALLGLPDPDDPLRGLRDRSGARVRAAGDPAGGRRLRAEGPLAARRRRGLGERELPVVRRAGASARPTRWTPSSTRPGTSCATPTR